MYQIEFSETAKRDLKWFKKYEQKIILDGIDANLKYEPNVETRNPKPQTPSSQRDSGMGIAAWRLSSDLRRV